MSEVPAQPTDTKVSKRPNFVRQLSKSYEKSKEAVKRNLLTPRGPRTAKSAELPLPEAKADAPKNSTAQAAPAPTPAPAVPKAAAENSQTIKVDIKATHDATTPVELLMKPAEKGAPEVHEGPATPSPVESTAPASEAEGKAIAPTPQPESHAPAPQPGEIVQPVQKEVPSLAAESTPAEPTAQNTPETHEQPEKPVQTKIEVPADLGCTPPAVSVTFSGAPAHAEEPAKAASKALTPEPAQQGKKGRGLRRALIGLVAVAAASVAAVNARR